MRVLVCDDDADVGGFLVTMFEIEGWEGRLVTSAEECLEALSEVLQPDVLVLDQVMPGMTGTQIADRLRGQGFDRPIVLCSAHIAPELDADIDRLGLIPVNKIDVQALVRTAEAVAGGAGDRTR